jgi:hypothetical protein
MTTIKSMFGSRLAKDFYRLLPLLGFAAIVLVPDDSAKVILFGMGIVMLAVGIAHIVRKLIFPYFDIAKLADGIEDDTKASAAVICGLIFLVCTIINAFVALLK